MCQNIRERVAMFDCGHQRHIYFHFPAKTGSKFAFYILLDPHLLSSYCIRQQIMSLGTVSASCLSPLGQISYEFVDIKQFNLCKYSSLLFPCSNLRSHSCITEVRDDVCMIVIDLLIDERFQHFSFLNSSVTFSSSSFHWSCY